MRKHRHLYQGIRAISSGEHQENITLGNPGSVDDTLRMSVSAQT
jgi:hypothetical protein